MDIDIRTNGHELHEHTTSSGITHSKVSFVMMHKINLPQTQVKLTLPDLNFIKKNTITSCRHHKNFGDSC